MANSSLSIERQVVEKGAVLLQLAGIVDAQTFETLEIALQQVLERGGHRIVVDLTQVRYVSSAGIGVFMNAMAEAQRHKGNLVLLNLSGEVSEVFDALHLTHMFHITDSLEKALEFF